MSKVTRIAVLVTSLASLFGVLSPSAGAVTWTNTGDTNFTATAGAGTLSAGATSLTCGSADAAGTSPMAVAGVVATVMTGTVNFTSCQLAGINVTFDCGESFTASSFTAGATTGTLDVTCRVAIAGTGACHIEGAVPYTWLNRHPLFAISGWLHNNLVTATDVFPGSCRLGNRVSGTWTPLTFTVTTGTGGPNILRD